VIERELTGLLTMAACSCRPEVLTISKEGHKKIPVAHDDKS
jgi:hypothetical protein